MGILRGWIEHWARPEYLPPELCSKTVAPTISLRIDVWALGTLLRELISVSSKLAHVEYSLQLVSLQEHMLNPNHWERPTADYVLRYITQKESLLGAEVPRASQADMTSPPPVAEHASQPGFFGRILGKLGGATATKYVRV